MANAALVISYLFLVLVVVVVLVICCLGCGCHVPLGKCVRCFCSNTTRCCTKLCPRKKGEDKHKSALDHEEGGTEAKAKEAHAKETAADGACAAGCLHWVPFVLSCGYCCGAYKEGESKPPRGASVPTVVGQPVNAAGTSTGAGGIAAIDLDEVMGTDYVVAVKMPLLSISR